ncbi:MAG: hypothetical protein EOL86_13000 [Deltaproteobacteria bacterium]|jgi:hypothetical protein|nr:hypothetical protein [Deltaproteobacteria bacterium]
MEASKLGELLGNARQHPVFWKYIMYAIMVVLVALNVIIRPHHPHFAGEWMPGFWAVFSLVATIAMVRACKGAAHTFLGKKEGYYDR